MKKSNHVDFLYIYLVFYIFWGWAFTQTVFENAILVYASFLFLLFGFVIKFINCSTKGKNCKSRTPLLFVPFFLYTSLQYLLSGDVEKFSYWLIGVMLLLIGSADNVSKKIPYKLIFYFGLFAAVGIFVQIFSPSFYSSRIQPLFPTDSIDVWISSEYGFNGFTYQLAATAEILVCAECIILCLWKDIFPRSKAWIKITFLILIIVCVFLTGKRTNSAIALCLPFFLPLLSTRKSGKRWMFLLFALGIFALFVNYLITNSDNLLSSSILRRSAQTIIELQNGESFSSGRDSIWAVALKFFHENPVFGIGPGEFAHKSGIGTDVHNVYLQCLCEQGIVGFILFVIPLIYCFVRTVILTRDATDKRRVLLMLSIALQINYILEGVTENMNINLDGYLILAIAIAILADCENRQYYDESTALHIQ